jgi:hypothetical protein
MEDGGLGFSSSAYHKALRGKKTDSWPPYTIWFIMKRSYDIVSKLLTIAYKNRMIYSLNVSSSELHQPVILELEFQ